MRKAVRPKSIAELSSVPASPVGTLIQLLEERV